MNSKELALEGVRVIDFATVVAAPSAARVLADMGADVIKVESTGGDLLRLQDYKPFLDPDSYAFTNCNSNKKCVSINIKNDSGYEALMKLLEGADVFITNVRYMSLKRAGLDYETLKEKFPRLIFAHFNSYGYEGADAELPGYDMSAFWCRSGALGDGMKCETERMFEPAYGLGVLFCAGYFTTGILSALYARERTGHGTMVSTSLLNAGLWANGRNLLETQQSEEGEINNTNLFFRPYKCSDGKWISLAVDFNRDFPKAVVVFGLQKVAEDPRLTSPDYREHSALTNETAKKMAETIAKKPFHYWSKVLKENDLAYAPVFSGKDALKDPQVLENGFLETVEYSNGTEMLMPNIPIRFSEYEILKTKPGKQCGDDTSEVLKVLGYEEEQISKMKADGSIK